MLSDVHCNFLSPPDIEVMRIFLPPSNPALLTILGAFDDHSILTANIYSTNFIGTVQQKFFENLFDQVGVFYIRIRVQRSHLSPADAAGPL